jgi:hypothetical protein
VTAFAATLVPGPTELRGLRQLLTSWLEQTDASADVRDAVMLATHRPRQTPSRTESQRAQ